MAEPIAVGGTPSKYARRRSGASALAAVVGRRRRGRVHVLREGRASTSSSLTGRPQMWVVAPSRSEGQAVRLPGFPSGESTDRLVSLTTKLVSLADLEGDWDSYGAEAPARAAIQRAFESMLATWTIMRPESVLPSVEGGVTLVYASDGRGYAEIEFANDGEVVAAFKRHGERPLVWVLSDETSVSAAVRKLRSLLSYGA